MSNIPFTRLSNEEEENELDSVNFSTDDNRGLYLRGAGQSRCRTDYVLVYETCHENESTHEEPVAEVARLASLRATFEKQLERQGLILQRQTRSVRQPVYLLLSHLCNNWRPYISINVGVKFYWEHFDVQVFPLYPKKLLDSKLRENEVKVSCRFLCADFFQHRWYKMQNCIKDFQYWMI